MYNETETIKKTCLDGYTISIKKKEQKAIVQNTRLLLKTIGEKGDKGPSIVVSMLRKEALSRDESNAVFKDV